jgi:hypothetical protein
MGVVTAAALAAAAGTTQASEAQSIVISGHLVSWALILVIGGSCAGVHAISNNDSSSSAEFDAYVVAALLVRSSSSW